MKKILVSFLIISFMVSFAPLSFAKPSPVITIKEAKVDANNDFVPDLLNQTVTVQGICTVDNGILFPGRLQTYIQDDTAGICLYSSTSQELKLGDKVEVTGKITQYNGLTEIIDPTIKILSRGNKVPDPVQVTTKQANSEEFEGMLITFTGFAVDNVYSGSNFKSIKIDDGSGTWAFLQIWNSTKIDVSFVKKGSYYKITAIGSQYDKTAPYSDYYQHLLRYQSDIIEATLPKDETPPEKATEIMLKDEDKSDGIDGRDFTVYWKPAASDKTFNRYLIYIVKENETVNLNDDTPFGVLSGQENATLTGKEEQKTDSKGRELSSGLYIAGVIAEDMDGNRSEIAYSPPSKITKDGAAKPVSSVILKDADTKNAGVSGLDFTISFNKPEMKEEDFEKYLIYVYRANDSPDYEKDTLFGVITDFEKTVYTGTSTSKDSKGNPLKEGDYFAIVFTLAKTGEKSPPVLSPVASIKGEISYTILKLQIGSNTMYVNDLAQTIDVAPVIFEGRTLIPARYIVEPLGGDISWDGTERKVTIKLGEKLIELWIDKPIAKVNGVNTPIDAQNPKVAPKIISGRTMLPLRFIAENLGCKVEWDAATRTVTITYPKD